MGFVTQPTEEGEKIDCPNCGKPLIARLKTYRNNDFPPKVQWQDKDQTKAHYDQFGNCKDAPQEQTQSQEPTPAAPQSTAKVPPIDPELKSKIEGETLVLLQINTTVTDFLKTIVADPNGGMIGQFTQIIYDKHFFQS